MYFHSMTDEELISYCVAQDSLTPLEVELYLRLAQMTEANEPEDVDALEAEIAGLDAKLRTTLELI